MTTTFRIEAYSRGARWTHAGKNTKDDGLVLCFRKLTQGVEDDAEEILRLKDQWSAQRPQRGEP